MTTQEAVGHIVTVAAAYPGNTPAGIAVRSAATFLMALDNKFMEETPRVFTNLDDVNQAFADTIKMFEEGAHRMPQHPGHKLPLDSDGVKR